MKRAAPPSHRAWSLVILLTAWPVVAAGQGAPAGVTEPAAGRIPPYARVVDESGLVDPASLDAARRILGATEDELHLRIAIRVVRSFDGQDPERLAAETYRAWRLGRLAADDGLLLLHATEERAWVLHLGPALRSRLAGTERLEQAQAALARNGAAEAGARIVEAATVAARAVGASRAAVARPFDRRYDWDRVLLASLVVAMLAGSLGLGVGLLVLARRARGLWARLLGRPPPPRVPVVVVRAEGDLLWVTARAGPVGAMLAIFFLFSFGEALVGILDHWRQRDDAYWCSHLAGVCTVLRDGEIRGQIPLRLIERFEAFEAGPGGTWALGVVTGQGNKALAVGWSRAALEAQAARLEAFRQDPDAAPEHHQSEGQWLRPRDQVVLVLLVPLVALVLHQLVPWRLRCDRRRGVITHRGPGRWRRWPAASITAIQRWSPLQAQIEAARRKRRPMPAWRAAETWVLIGMRDRSGVVHPVGNPVYMGFASLADRAADLEAAARRLAEHLGVPFLESVEPPPAGTVPPLDPPA